MSVRAPAGAILAVLAALAAGCKAPAASPDAAAPPDAAPDAPSFAITGREVVRQVANDAQHLPVVSDVPRHTVAISAIFADGSTHDVPVAADGSFAFASPSAELRVAVARDGAPPVEYQLAASHLDFAPALAGRYDRTPPSPGTALAVQVTSAPGGTAVVDTTGLWTQTKRSGGSNGDFTVDWTQASSLSGPVGLLDATAGDRAYVTFHGTAGSPAYGVITAACSADVTMTDGATTMATCTAQALAPDHCVHVQAPLLAEATRLAGALPASPAYAAAYYGWFVMAIPAPTLGPVGGLWLAYQGDGGAPAADVDEDVLFANPFPGHDATVAVVVGRVRTYALTGASPIPLYAETVHYVAPAADCATPTVVAGSVAIAGTPAFDGVALDRDGLEVGLDRALPHALAWELAAPGDADAWMVSLYEVTAPAGQTTLALRRTWIAARRTIALDPAVFTLGSTYLFSIAGTLANPDAASGDFRTVGYPAQPYASSTIWSGAFEVAN